jgi:hypothetical protein
VGFGDVPIVNYLQLQIERDGEVMFRAIESLASDIFVHQAPSIKKTGYGFNIGRLNIAGLTVKTTGPIIEMQPQDFSKRQLTTVLSRSAS